VFADSGIIPFSQKIKLREIKPEKSVRCESLLFSPRACGTYKSGLASARLPACGEEGLLDENSEDEVEMDGLPSVEEFPLSERSYIRNPLTEPMGFTIETKLDEQVLATMDQNVDAYNMQGFGKRMRREPQEYESVRSVIQSDDEEDRVSRVSTHSALQELSRLVEE